MNEELKQAIESLELDQEDKNELLSIAETEGWDGVMSYLTDKASDLSPLQDALSDIKEADPEAATEIESMLQNAHSKIASAYQKYNEGMAKLAEDIGTASAEIDAEMDKAEMEAARSIIE